jgi:hypothetical protein
MSDKLPTHDHQSVESRDSQHTPNSTDWKTSIDQYKKLESQEKKEQLQDPNDILKSLKPQDKDTIHDTGPKAPLAWSDADTLIAVANTNRAKEADKTREFIVKIPRLKSIFGE